MVVYQLDSEHDASGGSIGAYLTLAMAAGVAGHVWTMPEIAAGLD